MPVPADKARLPLDLAFWVRAMRSALEARTSRRRLAGFLRRVLGGGAQQPLDLAGDAEACRYIRRLGIGAGDDVNVLVRRAAENASAPAVEVSLLVRLFASGAYGLLASGICGDIPECTRCPLADWCVYAAEGAGELPAHESFRERLRLAGEGALGAAELLALLIGGGKGELRGLKHAQRLLADAGSLRALAQKSLTELEQVAGISRDAAVRVRAAMGLAVHWASEPKPPGTRFSEGRDFFRYYRGRLRDKPGEHFIVALLDQKNRFIGEVVTGGGGLADATVDPRVILTRALREAAAKVAFVHNHPSGDPKPSPEDMELTGRLVQVAALAGIQVLDHVIIAGDTFVSMSQEGYI